MTVDEKALMAAVTRAMENAGTLSAKDSVKLVPADWHRICDLVLNPKPLALRPGSTGEAEGWRDIASAPESKWVLTCRAGENGINLCSQYSGEWHDQCGRSTVTHHSFAAPTHWMPCPKPPSAMLAAAGGRDE